MDHSFNIEVAKDVGIAPAVLLNNIYWWVDKNAKNNVNFFDGKYWTYNRKSAFLAQFPYLSESQIERALTKLRDEGYLEVGNYNKVKYDRTLWYTLTDKAYTMLQNKDIHSAKMRNGKNENEPPIQDINKNINKNIKESVEQSSTIPYLDIIQYLNTKAETKYKSSSKESMKHIKARWKEGYKLEDFFSVIDVKVAEWKDSEKMAKYLRPQTLFNEKFESYLQQAQSSPKKRRFEGISEPASKEDRVKNEDGSPVVF